MRRGRPARRRSRRPLPDDLADARPAARDLLAARRPTALVCASDLLALGALAAVQRARPRPGGDVAVVGFDDTPVAAGRRADRRCAQPLGAAAEAVLELLLRPARPRPAGPPAADGRSCCRPSSSCAPAAPPPDDAAPSAASLPFPPTGTC